jgi:hypothetical protein
VRRLAGPFDPALEVIWKFSGLGRADTATPPFVDVVGSVNLRARHVDHRASQVRDARRGRRVRLDAERVLPTIPLDEGR